MARHEANERWMDRLRRLGGVALALGMALSVGVGQSAPAAAEGSKRTASRLPTKEVAYVLGKLDGALSEALMEVLRPARWNGQTDGLVIMAGRRIHGLSSNTLARLLDVYAAGQPIVLAHALPEDLERLHGHLGSAVPVTLREPYEHFELYGHADTEFGPKAFAMMPPVSAQPSEEHPRHQRHPTDRLEDRLKRAEELPRWVELDVRQSARTRGNPDPGAQTSNGEILPIYADIQAWEVKQSFAVNYLWGTCDSKPFGNTDYYRDSCQAVYQAYVDVWPVYSTDQEMDYFIMQLSGNLSPGTSCYGWYDGRNHDDRLSAYWARQYEFTANVAQNAAACVNNPTGGPTCYWSFEDLSVFDFNPQTTNPTLSVQEGISWNIGGSGTAGPKGKGVGFSAGASFTHSESAKYQALATTAAVGDTASANQGQMQWSYDSWNFVSESIEPGDQACGGQGLWGGAQSAPAIITTGTFSPKMTYVWEVSEDMRNTYDGDTLPVDVDLGVLLGWAYYPVAGDNCNSSAQDYFSNSGAVQATTGDEPWTALSSSNPNPTGLDSLYFDVSCAINVNYGTVPLGPVPPPNQEALSMGNPGTPYLMSITANVPFASLTPP